MGNFMSWAQVDKTKWPGSVKADGYYGTNPFSEVGSQYMPFVRAYIDSVLAEIVLAQKVGIGTYDPAFNLDIWGTAGLRVTPDGTNDSMLIIENGQIKKRLYIPTAVGDTNLWELTGNDIQPKTTIQNVIIPTDYAIKQASYNLIRSKGSSWLIGSQNTTNSGANNTFLGFESGEANVGGNKNTFIGTEAGKSNTTSIENTAVGFEALMSVTAGQNANTAVGAYAAWWCIGIGNTVLGNSAAEELTSGNNNTVLGTEAGFSLGSGDNNTVIGRGAGHTLDNGDDGNVMLGYNAGYNENGDNTLYIDNSSTATPLIYGDFAADTLMIHGALSIRDIADGAEDSVLIWEDKQVKKRHLDFSTLLDTNLWQINSNKISPKSGVTNVGIGTTNPGATLDVSGLIWQTGTGQSTFIGEGSGANDDFTTNRNTSVGYFSMNKNTTGIRNTVIGWGALEDNQTTSENTAIGFEAMANLTVGGSNVAIGFDAMKESTNATANVALGNNTLGLNLTGNENTAIGGAASYNLTSGSYNVTNGVQADYQNQGGSRNTIIGFEAGKNTVAHSKTGNVFLGHQAGYNDTTDNKLYIENSSVDSNNALIWGDFADDVLAFNANVGVGTTVPREVLDVFGNISLSGSTSNGFIFGDTDSNRVQLSTDGGSVISSGSGSKIASLGAFGTNVTLSTSSTPRVTVIADGSVGIGTTAPDEKLHIDGNIEINRNDRIIQDDTTLIRSVNKNWFVGSQNTTLTTGELNTFIGYKAGDVLTEGDENVGIGDGALGALTTGISNVGIGHLTLDAITIQSNNTAIGGGAMAVNIASNNTAIGSGSLSGNTTGTPNIGIGLQSLTHQQTGANNIAIGTFAGQGTSTHSKSFNVIIGNSAGQSLMDNDNNNVMIGHQAGATNLGAGNVFLGSQAGFSETTSNKLYIENSNSATPLIYGEFDNNLVTVNGGFEATTNALFQISDYAFKMTNLDPTAGEDLGMKVRGGGNRAAAEILSAYDLSDNPRFIVYGDGEAYHGNWVGIGTTSPQDPLHIYDSQATIRLQDVGTSGYTRLDATSTTTTAIEHINGGGIADIRMSARPTNNTSSATLRFGFATETAGTVKYWFYNGESPNQINCQIGGNSDSYFNVDNGSVGIGTSSPTEKLEVNGNVLADSVYAIPDIGSKFISADSTITIGTTGYYYTISAPDGSTNGFTTSDSSWTYPVTGYYKVTYGMSCTFNTVNTVIHTSYWHQGIENSEIEAERTITTGGNVGDYGRSGTIYATKGDIGKIRTKADKIGDLMITHMNISITRLN